jgi:hypothetical protein
VGLHANMCAFQIIIRSATAAATVIRITQGIQDAIGHGAMGPNLTGTGRPPQKSKRPRALGEGPSVSACPSPLGTSAHAIAKGNTTGGKSFRAMLEYRRSMGAGRTWGGLSLASEVRAG